MNLLHLVGVVEGHFGAFLLLDSGRFNHLRIPPLVLMIFARDGRLEVFWSGQNAFHDPQMVVSMHCLSLRGGPKKLCFRAASEAEAVHANNHLRVMKGVLSTPENLKTAISGEDHEYEWW